MSIPPVALQAFTPDGLHAHFPSVPLSHARKVVARLHRDEPLTADSGISRASVDTLLGGGHVPALTVVETARSALDPFVKHVLRTHDGHLLETVRIPLERAGRYSVCVSSQVGCALGCRFCATGRLGLQRNLHAWEMVEQVRVVRRSLREDGKEGRVHGVVFQGMGEPLANLDRVLEAIRVLTDGAALAIDTRNITVSTSGLPAGIRRLAREAPKVRLGLSLHAARPTTRRSLMPIDEAHPLDAVLDAAVEHAVLTQLAPMWSVTLLAGHNDSVEDAQALADLCHAFVARTGGVWPRVSIIPYNRIGPDGDDPYRRVDDAQETLFRDTLAARHVFAHKRYSGGHDVGAACGQLAARAG